MNQRTSPHCNWGNLSEWKTVQYQRAFQEEVQAVRTGRGTAAGKEISDNYAGILRDIERGLGMEEAEENINSLFSGW